MWGESSKKCEIDCQCSGLITDKFKINSGNSATKRRREDALTNNYKSKMSPHTLNFTQSPKSPLSVPPKRRILGEIQNTFAGSPLRTIMDQNTEKSPQIDRNSLSPLTSRCERSIFKRSTTKISRIVEERSSFKSNKENESLISETFIKLDVEEETRDSFAQSLQSPKKTVSNWSRTELNFSNTIQSTYKMESTEVKETFTVEESVSKDLSVPEKELEADLDPDFETLHDLEQEFDADNFDQCTKYEIISTDSPDIISRGRSTTSRKINLRNFEFGAPLSENEPSTSFNRPSLNATRMLKFEEAFEFPSPPVRKPSVNLSVKKSLKFNETPPKNALKHERSDSSIGSMSSSPSSSRLKIFTSESTTSMESGFISEMDEPFFELEDQSNSPGIANIDQLLSGQIRDDALNKGFSMKRPSMHRSLSFNPASKAKMSLLSVLESPKKGIETENEAKKKKWGSEREGERIHRPVLQRALSENNASIMSALARSAEDPDLIGDFSQPFALPLTSGNHDDLKSISCHTLAALIRGEFRHSIEDFQVIDCRYPYEFDGGHILGAVNFYTPSQVLTLVNKPLQPKEPDSKRSILVFHCEFSLERGPKLSRFLRSSDRAKNKENYPSLHYPEIYLLHEGYRSFYKRYPDLCSPNGYTAMLDPNHRHLLRQHRADQENSTGPKSATMRRHRLF